MISAQIDSRTITIYSSYNKAICQMVKNTILCIQNLLESFEVLRRPACLD